MKRIICLLCVLLASVCVLTACTKSAGSLFTSDAREGSPALTKMTESATVKGICCDKNDEFALFVEQPVNTDPKTIIRVFGFEAGKVVYESPSAIANGDAKLLGYGLFAILTPAATSADVNKWTVYDTKGKAVREFSGTITPSNELLYAEHTVFEMAGGELKKTGILWNEGDSLRGDRVCENYRFESSVAGCAVYDLGGNLMSAYYFPSHAGNTSAQMLNNGNVLIQYTEKIGQKGDDGIKARDYDYIDGSDGLQKLFSFIMNPKTGALRSVKLNGMVNVTSTRYQSDGLLAGGSANIAVMTEIGKDKRMDSSAMALRYVVLSNGGLVSDVQKLHPAQISVPQPVGKSWWLVKCADGSSLMFNKAGKLVSSISRTDTYGLNYIARSGMILDEKGSIAVDLTAKGLTAATAEENYAILADEKGNKYIYCNGKVIDFLINSKETVSDTEGNLILTQTVSGADTTVSVYNQTGEKLGSITNKLVNVAGSFLLAGDPSKQETVIYALK